MFNTRRCSFIIFFGDENNRNRREKKLDCIKSKRAGIAADPLLTNPLNSDTKLQIGAT